MFYVNTIVEMKLVDNRRKLHRRLDACVLYTDGVTPLWYVTPKQ